jgi:hypothetical protein
MRSLIIILVLCLALPAAAANRPSAGVAKPLDPANIVSLRAGSLATPDATVGNTKAPTTIVPDWFYGKESYTYPVSAGQMPMCTDGFAPLSVTIYMGFGPEDVPAVFTMSGALRTTTTASPGCIQPGARLVETPLYQVTVTEPGDYRVDLPFAEAGMSCIAGPGPWMAEVYFPDWFPDGMLPDGMADSSPTSCTSWYNFYDLGWEDLVADYGWNGNVVISMEAACCANGVPVQEQSWGTVKSLFR